MTAGSTMTPTAEIEKAKKRIWVKLTKIDDSFAEKLVEKAAEGVDIRLLISNWNVLISAIDSFIYEHERAPKLVHSLKRAMVVDIIALMVTTAYIGISLYFGMMSFGMSIILSTLSFILAAALYRMVQLYRDKATKAYKRAQTARAAIGRNLKVAIMPNTAFSNELYIVDDRAWSIRIWSSDGGPIELDVKGAEKMFAKLWKRAEKKADSPIFKLFNDIIAAEKRIWIAAPKIGRQDADLLVRVASMASKGADVQVIADDTKNLTYTVKRYSQLIRSAKSKLIKWSIEFLLLFIFGAIFIITPLIYIFVPSIAKPTPLTFIVVYLPLLFIYILWARNKIEDGYLAYIIDKIEEYETEIGELSLIGLDAKLSSLKHMNIIKAPIAEELYIVDDKAWVNHDGELREIDIKEAEKKFMELLNKYQPAANRKA